jgi:hypothetical protein
MLLFDIGTILFICGLVFYLTFRIRPPKSVQNMNDTQRLGCFGMMIGLSIVGGIIMIIAHYFVAGIPEAIKLW